jgi:uncharacterized DUF497 family protein
MDILGELSKCIGFQWDDANAQKIWVKHQVTPSECEQLFFHRPFVVAEDVKHSQKEDRYYALGQTDTGRLLFVVFTIRRNLICVITARDMNRKESKEYELHEKEST